MWPIGLLFINLEQELKLMASSGFGFLFFFIFYFLHPEVFQFAVMFYQLSTIINIVKFA